MSWLYLVRHAEAVPLPGGDDSLRPLSALGELQAQSIGAGLAAKALQAVFSSPALRCRQTVAPLSRTLGVEPQIIPWLQTGGDPGLVWPRLVDACGEGNLAACTHADIIEGILHRVAGLAAEPRPLSPGATWCLQLQDGEVLAATFRLPGH